MEERIILSKRNCHRAAVVRNIDHPEWGDLAFHHNAEKLPGIGNYTHILEIEGDSKALHPSDMKDYKIISWKYETNLDEYWELARRAFNWTSFDPEKRGERTIIEHEQQLNADIKDMPEEEKERYISNYKRYFSAWLSACSCCASSAITGGSGFNTRRVEAANRREHDRYGDLLEWREKALKAIEKRKEEAKPAEQKEIEKWMRVKRMIDNHYLPTNLYNKLETVARNGDVEIINKAIEYVKELNENRGKPIFTTHHKFWKLPDVAEANKEKQADNATKENTEVAFIGGKVVNNFQENRIQIIFAEKPSPDIISQLKKSAFKWSPRFGAWQRQMTGNTVCAVKCFLKQNNLI